MAYLKLSDIVSGQEAEAKITIYNENGSTTVEDFFSARSLEATVEMEKAEGRTLGKRGTQHKPNGWNGTGTCTLYYVTSIFRKMAINYIKTGKPTYFDLFVKNEDPASTVGVQSVILRNCLFDSVVLAKFDVDAEFLDEDMDFTFDDADLMDEFGKPVLLG